MLRIIERIKWQSREDFHAGFRDQGLYTGKGGWKCGDWDYRLGWFVSWIIKIGEK